MTIQTATTQAAEAKLAADQLGFKGNVFISGVGSAASNILPLQAQHLYDVSQQTNSFYQIAAEKIANSKAVTIAKGASIGGLAVAGASLSSLGVLDAGTIGIGLAGGAMSVFLPKR